MSGLLDLLAEAEPGRCALCSAKLSPGRRVLCGARDCTLLYHQLYGHARRAQRGAKLPRRGESSSAAKLTEKAVVQIRALRHRLSQRQLAQRFGVAQTTISSVLAGRSWAHLPRML